MGNVYLFRGLAATGKTTLSDMLAKKLSIPVIRKDDIVDALKSTADIEDWMITNSICYNILHKIIQTNLDLGADLIVDVGLGNKPNSKIFYDRFDFSNNKVVKFVVICSDESEWKRRHEERIKNPSPNQMFISFEHVKEHYKNADVTPFDDEHVIDTANTLEECFKIIINNL